MPTLADCLPHPSWAEVETVEIHEMYSDDLTAKVRAHLIARA
jgi:hypothetical protein